MYLLLLCFILFYQAFAADLRVAQRTILDEPSCGDLKTACNNLSENDDLLILECLQVVNQNFLQTINENCQHVIWDHTRALIDNEKVRETLMPVCREDLGKINCNVDGSGGYLKCIVLNKENILTTDCMHMVLRLEGVAFTDYQFINSFLEHCSKDIQELQCGRIDHNLSQLKTLTCLQTYINKIDDECKREVLKLSEIQSDSIKFDAQLYLNCAEDYSRYCSQFSAGSGKIFPCLMRQDQRKLSAQCKQHLLRRQKLIAQDYRVSKGLLKSCRDDIKKTHCRKQTSSDKAVRLAQILLCLENMIRNGTKVESGCEAELVEHRRMLMEDYRLSPEIVDGCKGEIAAYCNGIEVGGKTIHCLMNFVMQKGTKGNEIQSKVDDKCQRAIESLVKQSDAGENWEVDPVLRQACYPVVRAACRDVAGGDARVMSCLMDNIDADHMTEACEDALVQIQYFVARDFDLDPQLYRACRQDAARYCHMRAEWDGRATPSGPSYSREVLPCLYRYLDNREMQLTRQCVHQVRRVMRQRAISVDLQPEIEEVCLSDLGFYCKDKVNKGEEMMCLQKNLDNLGDRCHDAVETFTEIEGEHADLNPYIGKYCSKVIDAICNVEAKNDEGDIMECLIYHKNDPAVKSNQACRASIEHFQIISVKDYKFSYKFKVACKAYAMRFCGHVRSKNEVVHCLSEQVLNATVHGVKSAVSKDCKQQLKAQLFQQKENIEYDPILKAACAPDIGKFCKDVKHGNAQVLECLQSVNDRLSDKCEKEVFKIKKEEVYDNTVDFALNTMCADAIDQFCPHHEKENVLECLKTYKDQKGFSKKCRTIVMHRIVEENSNYQLNPSLQQNCQTDISKLCKKALNSPEHNLNGPVIKCLKEQFKLYRLSNKCEKEIASILREQALDVELNPLIRTVCKNELETICRKHEDEDGPGPEECLKDAFLESKIQTPECKLEVANIIEESHADIEVDPLLQRTCALDLLNFCNDVPTGNSRHIQCLKIMMDNNPQKLSTNCKNMLKKRLQMYRNVAEYAPPEDLQQLYRQVVTSPSKHYFFLMILTLIGSIFVVGIFCGRFTRNKYMLLKNK